MRSLHRAPKYPAEGRTSRTCTKRGTSAVRALRGSRGLTAESRRVQYLPWKNDTTVFLNRCELRRVTPTSSKGLLTGLEMVIHAGSDAVHSAGTSGGAVVEASVLPVSVVGLRLDRLPAGRSHRLVLLIISLGIFFDFFDSSMAGALAGALLSSRWSTLELNTVFLAASGVGGVIGNLLIGYLADRYGRRAALSGSLLLVGAATAACALAPSMQYLIGFRLISCVGIAAVPTVGFSILAEFLPPVLRGRWTSFGGTIANSSVLCASLAGYLLLPSGLWRWLCAIPGFACIALGLITRRLPESPRWLESIGKREEAERIVSMMERDAEKSSGQPLAPANIAADPSSSDDRSKHRPPQTRVYSRLLFGITIAVGANVAIFGFLTWLPTMLLKQGFTISNSLGHNALIAIGTPLGSLLGVFFADRFGRRRGIVTASAVTLILALVFARASGSVLLVPVGVALLTGLAFLVNVIYAIYLPELFPTTIRVRGIAIAAATTKGAFIVLPFAMAVLLRVGGMAAGMMLIAGCLLLVASTVGLFGRETAHKSLEETSV